VSKWRSVRATQLFAALLRAGWTVQRSGNGSHKILTKEGWPPFTWSFHARVEVGPPMLAKIAKATGLTPEDL
jgi:predicted RNA binding protein YcfA (HicA-like mRNA interferase family)